MLLMHADLLVVVCAFVIRILGIASVASHFALLYIYKTLHIIVLSMVLN